MKFSIVTNTRCRPFMMENCINSVFDTAKHPDNVEFLIRHDIDDLQTINLSTKDFKNVKFVMGERPASLHSAINSLCRSSLSNIFWILNDDCEIKTQDWDEIVKDRIIEFKASNSILDNILYMATSDTSVDKPAGMKYSSFPMITKEAFACLGYFMSEAFVSLGGDSHLDRIYKSVRRVVDCSDILVDHLTHNTIEKVLNPDQSAKEYREMYRNNFVDPFTYDISNDIQKIESYIQGFEDEFHYGQK